MQSDRFVALVEDRLPFRDGAPDGPSGTILESALRQSAEDADLLNILDLRTQKTIASRSDLSGQLDDKCLRKRKLTPASVPIVGDKDRRNHGARSV
jgi:hypothetical protein